MFNYTTNVEGIESSQKVEKRQEMVSFSLFDLEKLLVLNQCVF